ncbi:hypothetical protein HNR65_001573 [Desulfosalsimonas propionicica]|uniref:Uncharacterized protein n=1 Tax=Desulfosalsimonas propionicica TaxID=332175 RepID=A0A7W0C8U1_9BACT|nr:hypothetical protein [Desulfosalsimonas propionicica]MBA2881247.1 hypothetical protein [Desulfosalsimonas propionicica]
MGKKSLTKSTAKKKTTTSAKKKSPEKKTAAASAKKGKTQKNTTKTKKPTLKSLRKKQFDAWRPEKPFVPEPDPAAKNAFTAPPVTGDYGKEQAETIRALLLWDLNEPSPVAKAPEPEAEKAQEPAAQKPEPPKEKPPEAETKAEPEAESKKTDPSKAEEKPADAETAAEAEAESKAEKTPEPEEKQATEAQPAPEKKPEKAEKKQKPEAAAKPEKSEKAKASEKPASSKKDSDSGGAAGPPGGPPEPPKPPVAEKKEPPLDPKLIGLIAIVGLLFLLIIGASFRNADNYYLKQTDRAIEIWKGKFSPRGQEKIVTLPGQQAPETEKAIYARKEALSLAFNHFMDRADALSEAEDLIDFQSIRENLEKAKKYASTDQQKQRVNQRLETMDFLMLLYKANVASEKQTLESLENAMEFLERAAALDISERARRSLEDRMTAIQESASELEEEAAAEKAAEAEQAAEAEETADAEKAAETETTSEAKQAGEDQQQDGQPAPEPNGDAAETTGKEADKDSDKQSGQNSKDSSQDSDDPGAQSESEQQ